MVWRSNVSERRLDRAPASSRPLEVCPVVYADSCETLTRWFGGGIPRDVEIRTHAPAVQRLGLSNIIAVEDAWPDERYRAFQRSIAPAALAAFRALETDRRLSSLAYPLAILTNMFHRTIYLAGTLSDRDLEEPRIHLRAVDERGHHDERLGPDWGELLAANAQFHSVDIRGIAVHDKPPFVPSLFTRLRFGGWESVLYYSALRFWRRMPARLARGLVLLSGDNELERETAAALALRGFALRRIKAPTAEGGFPIEQDALEAAARGLDALAPQLARWTTPKIGAQVGALYRSQTAEALSRHRALVEAGDRSLASVALPSRTVLLVDNASTMPRLPLVEAGRRARVRVASFQHGVTREICGTDDEMSVSYENGVADLFFAYNAVAARVSETSAYARGTCIVAGAPRIFRRMAARGRPLHPFMYVSTNLLRSSFNSFVCWRTDVDRVRDEIHLIDCVLAKLPGRVLFKPYPAIRYCDPNPVVAHARTVANLTVVERPIDLRYMVGGAHVILTTRATSTLGWCLASERPVVFIDLPGDIPLSEDAKQALAPGIFLFDAGDPDWAERVVRFLSQDPDRIDAEWARRRSARLAVLRDSVFGPGHRAGARAARAIIASLHRGATRDALSP
jgi:hypothetical protein